MRKRNSAGSARLPVAAVQPTTAGTAPGGSADHDVLGGRALQVARVDDHVEDVSEHGEQRRRHVREARQDDERERRQREPELERALRRDATGGDRSPVGSAHVLVDVAVEDVVERRGTAAGEREAAQHRGEEAERRHALRTDERSGGRRDAGAAP